MTPTPDGTRYLALGEGRKVPSPFHLRWLVPYICRRNPRRWVAATCAAWVVSAVCVALLAPSWQTGIAAAAMFAFLPGIRYNLGAPILVDLPSMSFALAAAVLATHGHVELAIAAATISAACKESGAVFAALYAWNPWLLIGLIAPLVRMVVAKPCPPSEDPLLTWRTVTPHAEHIWILEHPWHAGWRYHRSDLLNGAKLVAPWGGALAALAAFDMQLAACLAAAYGQLARATDTVRLYQWAAPVVCVAAVSTVPVAWLPLLVVLTVWNPHAGNGV